MSEKNKKGYVYILTNPSFREDWVKIGKSSREVDVRSKELDNTAVPLPFEIYATLRTEKYNEVENNLHEIFTDLADARVRKSREFFNIAPEKALKYLRQEANLLPDAELNVPDEEDNEDCSDGKRAPVRKGKYTIDTDEIFYFHRDSTDARMRVESGGKKYVVLAGSRIDPKVYSAAERVGRLRQQHTEVIDDDILIDDVAFSAPSAAGVFVAGGSVNGKYYWRTKDGRQLNEFIVYEDKK